MLTPPWTRGSPAVPVEIELGLQRAADAGHRRREALEDAEVNRAAVDVEIQRVGGLLSPHERHRQLALRRQPLRVVLLELRVEHDGCRRVVDRAGERLPRDVAELAVADREVGGHGRRIRRPADDRLPVDAAGQLLRTEQERVDDAEVDVLELDGQRLPGLAERAVGEKLLLPHGRVGQREVLDDDRVNTNTIIATNGPLILYPMHYYRY